MSLRPSARPRSCRDMADSCWLDDESSSALAVAVTPRLRGLLRCARLNLARPPFPMRGPFDMVFCRNVMIYFDEAVRMGLLDEIYRLLRPGGHLVVGSSESLLATATRFSSVHPSIYRKD